MSKGRKASRATPENLNWDEGLVNEAVESDSWRPYLVFLGPEHVSLQPHLQAMVGVADGGNRRRFTVIDRESMLQMARDDAKLAAASGGGGGGKKSKQNSAAPAAKPLHAEVCEHVVNALSSGGQVPAALVAKMLKYTVLKQRTLDLARQEALRKEAEDASKPQKAAAESKGGKKGASSGRASKAAGGKKAGKETPAMDAAPAVPVPQKPPTTMKKRGEEDLDSKYLDDEPRDGPDCYFLLTGYTSTELFKQLSSVKLTAHSLVKVGSNETVSLESDTLTEEELHRQENILATFWSRINHVIKSTPSGSMLRDMALLDLNVEHATIPVLDEEKATYGQTLFDALSEKIYKTVQQSTQHKNYLNYLDVQPLPLGLQLKGRPTSGHDAEESSLPSSSRVVSGSPSTDVADETPTVDMRYYRELLSAVPEESCSIPLILHCMAEQVSTSLSGNHSMRDPQRVVDGTHPDIMAEINSTIATLALPATEKETDADEVKLKTGSVHEAGCTVMVPHGDVSKQRTFHLRDSKLLKVSEVDSAVHHLSPMANLLSPSGIPKHESIKEKAQLHAVEYFCVSDKLSVQSLKHALVLLSLEQHQLPSASSPPSPIPFALSVHEDPSTAVVPYGLPDGCSPQASSEPCSSQPESEHQGFLQLPAPVTTLTEYSVCEYLKKDALLQLIQGLQHSTHPYVETFYHRQSQSVMLILHTGFDSNPTHTYRWKSQAHSQVGFQNYLRYVAEEFGGAVDKAVEEDNKRRLEIEEQRKLMIEERLKEMTGLEPDQEEEKKVSAKGSAKGSSASSAKKTPASKSPGGKRSKLESKEATPPVSTHSIATPIEQALPEFKERKLFTAHDVGDTVLLCQGQQNTQFTADGAQVRTEKYQFAEGETSTKVSLHVGGHSLYVSLMSAQAKIPEEDSETGQPCLNGDEAPNEEAAQAEIEVTPTPSAGIPQPPEHIATASFQASFENGLMLSFSHYGPSGNGELPFEPEKPEILQAASRPISSADSRSQSRQGVSPQKLSKKQQEQQQQLLEQQRLLEEQQAKERKLAEEKYKEQQESLMRHNKYQQLFASTQYGLHVHCQVMADAEADPSLTDGSDGFVVARQCYPVQTSGTQDCEEVLSQTAFKEKSRCYLPSGSVVRYMHDSSIVVQCADGSVYHTANPAQVEAYKSAFSQTTESQMDQAAKEATETIERVMSTTRVTFADETDKDKVKKPPSNAAVQVWVVTTPDGTRYLWRKEKQPPSIQEKGDGVEVPPSEAQDEVTGEAALDPCPADENVTRIVPLTKLECFPATDPVSKEVLVTREDNVITLLRPNSTKITEFSDGTRFTIHSSSRGCTQPGEMFVECPGFARVSFFSANGSCQVVFPDNSNIECSTDGSYVVTKSNDYTLRILASGEALFTPGHKLGERQYSLDHTGSGNLFECGDHMESKFYVSAAGEATVDFKAPDSMVPTHPAFSPRYFTVESDGSCHELIRKETADAVVAAKEKSPLAIVVRDALPGCSATTVMEPCDAGSSTACVVPYLEESIVPANLQYHKAFDQSDARDMPADSLDQGGPPRRFGVGVGKALAIGDYRKPPPPKAFSPPAALKYRQFVYYSPLDDETRRHIYSCLSNYTNWQIQQEREANAVLPVDKRPDSEKLATKELQTAYKEGSGGRVNTTDSELAEKYVQGATKPPADQQVKPRENTQKRQQIHEAIATEKKQTEMMKTALREHQVPPYFESEEYLRVQSPDMEGLSKRLAKPQKPVHPILEGDPGVEQQLLTGRSTPNLLQVSAHESGSPVPSDIAGQLGPVSSLSKLRPSNPTPNHAHGNGSPTELRPTNPTPSHAVDTAPDEEQILPALNGEAIEATDIGTSECTSRQDFFTEEITNATTVSFALPSPESKQDDSMAISSRADYESPEDAMLAKSPRYKSTLTDVTGEPRRAPVKSPASIQGGKPGEKPNTKFAAIEEPVRRQVHTSSTTAAIGRIIRGLEVLPERVDFGVLKEGCTYAYTVALKNVGIDSCRFKIKQPPPSTGIKIIYTPGAVAAGMSRNFDVEIFAIAVGVVGECGEGAVRHELEIVTETSSFYLPIQAAVQTTSAYSQSPVGLVAGVQLVADRPLSRESVTRPSRPQ